MTDKLYLITAQKIAELIANAKDYNAEKIAMLLQSLPMVDSVPICHLRARTASTPWNSFEPVPRDMDNAFPVYTSPQALTQISADDVTDEMINDCLPHWMMTELEDVREIFVQIYNAVIKIGVKHERKNSNSD